LLQRGRKIHLYRCKEKRVISSGESFSLGREEGPFNKDRGVSHHLSQGNFSCESKEGRPGFSLESSSGKSPFHRRKLSPGKELLRRRLSFVGKRRIFTQI